MKILNPRSGKMEEVLPLSPESRKTIYVVVVADEVLYVEPTDYYRVYMSNGPAPYEFIEFDRALGHSVVLLNDKVFVNKVAGSWRVAPLEQPQNNAKPVSDCVVYTVFGKSTVPREFDDPAQAATAFVDIPGEERPSIIRVCDGWARAIAQTSQVGCGDEAKYGKCVSASDPVLKAAYEEAIWNKAESQAKHQFPHDIRAQNAFKRDVAEQLGMTKQQIAERTIDKPKTRESGMER